MKKVGSILKKARLEKKLSFEDISSATKIHPKFLKALEEGDWEIFSSAVHLKGFLKNYAEFLGLDPSEVLAFWRREFDETKKKPLLKSRIRPLSAPRFLVTPTTIAITAGTLLTLFFFGYLFWQYRSLTGPPYLAVEFPENNARLRETIIESRGRVDKDAILRINGQKVSINEDGTFAIPLSLSGGINTLEFVAENKLGQESKISRTVIVEAAAVAEAPPAVEEEEEVYEGLELKIQIGPNAAWLQVFEKETKIFEGMMLSGAEKTFQSKEGLRIKTGNAGSTKVVVNGEDRGVLGKGGEVVEREFHP